MLRRLSLLLACAGVSLGLVACQAPPDRTETISDNITATTPSTSTSTTPETVVGAEKDTALATYPLKAHFQCLPQKAALVAAHRGVSKGQGLAENSLSSLQTLIGDGILVAEVDIAGLKDGTHILFHDGVWEEKSTGSGAVASSDWETVSTYLLKDTDGTLTADRPVKLVDVLEMAKDKLYLEIDFKSSAKYDVVIDAIRNAGMADRVILIAYTDAQARKMASLAPEMLLSVGLSDMGAQAALEAAGVKVENMAAWMGRGPYDTATMQRLSDQDIPLLAWPSRDAVAATAGPASLIVSDYAAELSPIIGLSDTDMPAYAACLNAY